MKGVILHYRGGAKKRMKQMLVKVEGVDTKEKAEKLTGKTVVWRSPAGKRIEGKIMQPHGGKGAVRVHFSEAGLPGQSIGNSVDIE